MGCNSYIGGVLCIPLLTISANYGVKTGCINVKDILAINYIMLDLLFRA